jgi:DNA polymerase-3 subunit gamma/tau
VEDLLERLRDLLVLAASGESGAKALGALPEDQLARMREQARVLGLTRASRAADLVNDALTAMVGAAAPRLHLELLCARLIAADGGGSVGVASTPEVIAQAAPVTQPVPVTEAPVPPPSVPAPEAAGPPPSAPRGAVASGSEDAELIRRRWQEVLGTLERHRVTWAMVSQSAIVTAVDAGVLRLTFDNAPLAGRFAAGDHAENVALAVRETLGLHVRVEAATGPAAAEPAHTVSAGVATATGMTPVVTAAPKPVTASGRTRAAAEPPPPEEPEPYDEISDDDATDAQGQLTGAEAVAKLLGGTVVET